MADKAQQTLRDATAAAKEAAESGEGTVRRASEDAARGYEELSSLSRDNMEGVARASRALLSGSSELSNVWMSFWSEQLAKGIETTRSLAECRSWGEALTVQNEFTRASLERIYSHAASSVQLRAKMVNSSLKPLQECACKTVERFPRAAA